MSKSKVKSGLITFAEEAFFFFKSIPVSVHSLYYIGTIPFVISILYFWYDMMQNPYAENYNVLAALGMTITFCWMKTWHSIYVNYSKNILINDDQFKLNFGIFCKIFVIQTIVQPIGFILIPLSLIVAIPFPWVYAYYQNLSYYGIPAQGTIKEIHKKVVWQCKINPKQNTFLIWIYSPIFIVIIAFAGLFIMPYFSSISPGMSRLVLAILSLVPFIAVTPLTVVMMLNLSIVFIMIPNLMKSLLGIDTIFSASGFLTSNTTYLAIIYSLTYMLFDPLMKITYLLRCFYGDSIKSGEDLLIKLRQFSMKKSINMIVVFIILLFVNSTELLSETSQNFSKNIDINLENLDNSIDVEISKKEYIWKFPNQKIVPERDKKKGLINSILKIYDKVIEWVKKSGKKIAEFFEKVLKINKNIKKNEISSNVNWDFYLRLFLLILIIAGIVLLFYLIYRNFKEKKSNETENNDVIRNKQPDLEEENIDIISLPENGWIDLANELLSKGKQRLALRAYFIAGLVLLADNGLIVAKKFKSNTDYKNELIRRARNNNDLINTFKENLEIFEKIWYGMHELSTETFNHFKINHTKINDYVA